MSGRTRSTKDSIDESLLQVNQEIYFFHSTFGQKTLNYKHGIYLGSSLGMAVVFPDGDSQSKYKCVPYDFLFRNLPPPKLSSLKDQSVKCPQFFPTSCNIEFRGDIINFHGYQINGRNTGLGTRIIDFFDMDPFYANVAFRGFLNKIPVINNSCRGYD